MTIQTAFPDFDLNRLPAIPANWTDISYCNDECPSFQCGDCQIFITDNGYSVLDINTGDDLFYTEAWNECLAFVQSK